MPNITYSLGGVSFDAVPKKGAREVRVDAKSSATLGRKRLVSLAVPGEKVFLAGDYLTEATRVSLEALIAQTETSGTKHTFDFEEKQYYSIIERFECTALVGVSSAAHRFEIDLLLLGEVSQ